MVRYRTFQLSGGRIAETGRQVSARQHRLLRLRARGSQQHRSILIDGIVTEEVLNLLRNVAVTVHLRARACNALSQNGYFQQYNSVQYIYIIV